MSFPHPIAANLRARSLAAAAVLAACACWWGANAQAQNWTGNVSTDWNNPANWLDGIMPASGNGVMIDNATGFAPILSATNLTNTAFYIAYNNTASLTISNGSQVTAQAVVIGYYAGAFGNLNVTGANTSLTVTPYTYIGGGPGVAFFPQPPIIGGNGTLTVSNGATVNLAYNGEFENWARIGRQAGSTGNIIVTGANSTLNAGTELDLGILGPANISIANGGRFNKTSLPSYFGYNSGNRADLTVSGANSRWTSSSPMYVGDRGLSNVTVSSNGTLAMTDSANLTVGNIGGSSGNILVTTNGTLSIGAGSTLTLAKAAGSNGTLILTNNGTLEVFSPNPIVRGNGTSNFTLGNSTFRLGADLTLNLSANMEANGRTVGVDTNGFNGTWNVTLMGSPSRSFVKKGAGQLQFNGTVSWNSTRLENGTLYFDGAHAPTASLGILTMNATTNPTIIVIDGANITSTGSGNSINGTAFVSGPTTRWKIGSTTTIGGNLTISNGGNFTSLGFVTAAAAISANPAAVMVTGSNSTFNGLSLTMGNPGNSSLVVANGGLVSFPEIRASNPIPGRFANISLAGGTLKTTEVGFGSRASLFGSGSINGTLNMQAGSTLAPDILSVMTGNVILAGNATFSLNDLSNFSQVTLSGAGNLTYGGNLTLDIGSDARAGIYPLFVFPTKTADFASVSLTGAFSGALSGSGGVWTTTASGWNFAFDTAMGRLRISLAAPAAAWEEWQDAYFTSAQLTNSAISGNAATPANDGIPNLVKYAFNLDAWTSSNDALPPAVVNGTNLVLTFTKLHDELDYSVEASTDLADWGIEGVDIETSGNVVTASYPIPPPPAQVFLRIVVAPEEPHFE